MPQEIKGPEQAQLEKWAKDRKMVKVFLKARKSIYGWIEWITGGSIALSGTTELAKLPVTSLYIVNREAIAYIKDFQTEQKPQPQQVQIEQESGQYFLQKWLTENSQHHFRLFEHMHLSGRIMGFDQSVITIDGKLAEEGEKNPSEFMVFKHAIIFMR